MAIFLKKPTKATKSLKSLHSQAVFLKRLGHLLAEGFSMQGALFFLQTTGNPQIKYWVTFIQEGLGEGESLHDQLTSLNFPDQICSQIYFSMIHGKFAETIYACGDQLMQKMDRQKKIQQILTYPLMLVIFMVGMLFAMRYILLPHITQLTTSSSGHLGIGTAITLVLIRESPVIIILLTILSVFCFIFGRIYLLNKTAIEAISLLSKIPIVKSLSQLYYSQFLALQWGQLIDNGTHLKEMTDIMIADSSSALVREIGAYISLKLQQGNSLKGVVKEFDFLKKEFADIIAFGEQSSNLGKELLLYSTQCEEELHLLIEKLMTYIQPLIFIGIGLMIVAIYAALLLPTFSLLNGI